MNLLANIVAWVTLTLLIGDQVIGHESLVPQIKVVRLKGGQHNPKYIDKAAAYIIKHNATYNKVNFKWEQVQDMPRDAIFNIKVFASDAEYKTGKLLLNDTLKLCSETTNPTFYLEPIRDFTVKNKCFPKKDYRVDGFYITRFDLAIPDIHKISDYFYVVYTLIYNNEVLNTFTFYTEWGYLHADTSTNI